MKISCHSLQHLIPITLIFIALLNPRLFDTQDVPNVVVTFDVVNLYTNIPHTFGLEALDYWLEKHTESLHARFNKEFVLECAKFVLQNNNMKFNKIIPRS